MRRLRHGTFVSQNPVNILPLPPENGLVVFDFDGTITTKDTFALFLRYYSGPGKWLKNIVFLMPTFMSYKLKLIDRHKVKAAVIDRFFKGESAIAVDKKAAEFAKSVIPALIRPAAQLCFDEKKADLESLYICSASIAPYLRHWAAAQGLPSQHVLAVELEDDSGVLTGQIKGYNVWGENKVRRVNDAFRSGKVNIKEAYGDTRGDKELLNAAKASFYKPFRL